MQHFRIKNLPAQLPGLLQYLTAIFGIRMIADIRPFVQKAHAVGVEHNSEWIAVLAKSVANVAVTVFRRIEVPVAGMRPGPVAIRLRSYVQRHLDPISGVVTRTAHLGQIPTRSQVART